MWSIRYLTLACCLRLLAVGDPAAAPDRLVEAVDNSRRVFLPGHLHPQAQARFDEGPVDPGFAIAYATLYLRPGPELEAFLAQQQNPSSPEYRRWLTPEQFGDRFGLSSADLAAVRSWLEAQGLQVHDVARGRHWITFSGTAGTVGRAFGTSLHHYRVGGKLHFANASPLSVPAAFHSVVAGVDGLHDFLPQPLHIKAPVRPEFNSNGSHFLSPADLAVIYDFAPLYNAANPIDGTGQKIAVIGRSGVSLADVRQFRKQFNLPAKDPQLVRFGPEPGIVPDDMEEAHIDLEWAGAVARNADIFYVYAASVASAAQYAVDQNIAPVMTYSYGGCELESTTPFRAVAQQANAQGITWFAASGDSGAATCDETAPTEQAAKGATVDVPASYPEVTAVGGTQFDDGTGAGFWAASNNANGASALSYIPERAWNEWLVTNRLQGTGGGASGFFPKPAWQTGPGVPNDNARDVPDVSLAASELHYGYLFVNGGSVLSGGGTSFASPVWAGLAALLNQRLAAVNPSAPVGLGNINPMLYRLAQATSNVFHDVTAGDNKMPCKQGSPDCVSGLVGFATGTGFDLATGLGSVDAANLIKEWVAGPASNTTVVADPSAVRLTDTVKLTATVTGSGKVTPTGSVAFVAGDTTVGTGPLIASAAGATASVTVPAALLAFAGTVSAVYSGDGVYAASWGDAPITLNLPATGTLVVPFVSPNPVYKNGTTNSWTVSVSLAEKAGVAATLTGFTIGSSSAMGFFPSTVIPAHGTITTALSLIGLTPPTTRTFTFTGTDATGQTWTQQLTVPFADVPGPSLTPSISLTSPLPTVQQNPQADPSCQWSQPLTLQELGGFEVTLAGLTVGGANMSSQIQQLFGTQRLAPYGMLQATICFPSSTALSTKAYIVTGSSELGNTVNAALNTPFVAAPASAASLTVSDKSITLPAGGANSATVNLTFGGGTPQWTASISPANRTSAWLTVSPASGTGDAALRIQVSPDGLSHGAYNAVVNVQAANSLPQSIALPVTFVIGQSNTTSVAALQNAFSARAAFAPGMLMSVYGNNLAPATAQADRLPLPLVLAGVSATVNGISAPLRFVSPGQINLQVPYETGAGPAVLAINNNGQVTAFSFTVAAAAPGLYTSAVDLSGRLATSATPGQLLLLFMTGEGDVTPSLATGATPSSTITDPTKLPHARLPVAVTVGGIPATVLFAGIPNGLAGVTQIDFAVPANAPSGPQPVIVTVGGIATPPITLNVTPPAGTSPPDDTVRIE